MFIYMLYIYMFIYIIYIFIYIYVFIAYILNCIKKTKGGLERCLSG